MGKKLSKILKGQAASSAFYILFGLCLVLMPEKMVGIICKVIFGLVLIGAGCYHIYIYVRDKEKATILDLFSGVIVLVIGGFLFYTPQVVMKLLQYLLGAFVLVDSIWSLQGGLKLKNRGKEQWKILLFGSLIFVVLGIAIMVNPFSQVRHTVIFAGWIFLCNGAADVAFLILLRKGMKEEAGTEGIREEKPESREKPANPEHEEWQDSWTDKDRTQENDRAASGSEEKADEILDGSWHEAEDSVREDISLEDRESGAAVSEEACTQRDDKESSGAADREYRAADKKAGIGQAEADNSQEGVREEDGHLEEWKD